MLPDPVLLAHRAGLSIIPQSMQKSALFKWKEYQTRQPTETELKEWHAQYPGINWAMVCGEVSKIIVLDFDGEEGRQTLERLDLRPYIRTPSGGYHVYVKWPGFHIVGGARVSPHFPGMDLRSDGNLATFYGKNLKGEYKVLKGRKLYKVEELPESVQALIRHRKRGANPELSSVELPAMFDDFMPRDEVLAEALEKIEAGGARNEVGFWLACQLRDERYPEKEAWRVLKEFAQKVSKSGKHPYTKQEAYNSLRQAFSQPPRLPRSLGDKGTFNKIFKTELARDAARQFIRSMKLPDFNPDFVIGIPEEDEPLNFIVSELQPEEANVLIVGQRKLGKTTFGLNLAKALLDGEPFLGRFLVEQIEGRVCYWNYEMSARQFNGWLRSVSIKPDHHDRFVHWPMRGHRMDIMNPDVFAKVVENLKQQEVEYLILDPWARAISGVVDENDNSQVAAFLERLDVMKEAAGVKSMVVMSHTGRGGTEGSERVRGASRLDDWADAIWTLARDEGGTRFMKAEGRDVDVPEFSMELDKETLMFEVTGGGRKETKNEQGIQDVVDAVRLNPGVAYNELYNMLQMNKNLRGAAIKLAKERGFVVVKPDGKKKLHYLNADGELPPKEDDDE